MGNGNVIGVPNITKSGVWGVEDVHLDVNGIRTEVAPRIGEHEKSASWIMGVSSEDGWHRIDAKDNTITVEGSVNQSSGKHTYFDNMPIYEDIQSVTVASSRGGQSLVRIPQFWFKREGTGLAGDPYKLWIADKEVEGFKKHPAFALKDHFHVGAYACGGNNYDSVAGLAPTVNIPFPTAQSAIVSNHGAGWEMWNIYQLSALQMLFLVEFGNPDAQTLIGAGQSSGLSAVANGASNAVYRGIHEFWANVWQMVDGLKGDASNVAQIWNPDGSKVYVPTGVTPPAGSGTVITSMAMGSGESFDLSDINLYGAAGSAAFSDNYWGPTANWVAYHGGSWADGAGWCVFALNLACTASNSRTYIGCRLAKV